MGRWNLLPGAFDGNEGNAQALIDWYNGGADGQIDWGQPGDFEQCVAIAGKHVDNPEGFCNERHQDAVGGPPGSEDKHAAEPYWFAMPQAERDKAANSGSAMPDGSFPITTCDGENSVDTAISAVGRGAADHDAIRRHIIKRADSLGCSSKIPDNWNADGSLKDGAATVRASTEPIGENANMTIKNRDAVLREFYASPVLTAATPPPPPPAAPVPPAPVGKAPTAPPKPDAEGGIADDEIDAGMVERLSALAKDVDDAIALQKTDPGTATEAPDAKVMAGLEQLKALLTTVIADQDADSKDTQSSVRKAPPAMPGQEAPAAPAPAAASMVAMDGPGCGACTHPGCTGTPGQGAMSGGASCGCPCDACLAADGVTAAGGIPGIAPTAPPPKLVPGNAEGVPNDSDDNGPGPGDIEASIVCQNPNCGHVAGVHADDATLGGNSGACATPGCACPGMIPDGTAVNSPSDSGEGSNDGQSNAGGAAAGAPLDSDQHASTTPTAFADAPPAEAPEAEAPAMEGAPAPELPPLDPAPNITVGPQFTVPVAWIEGVPTGDGRIIDPGAMKWRTPPLALMGLKTSPHDPSGMSGNDPAVLIGRIEEITRDGSNGVATGHLLATPEGMEFAAILEQMGRMGVSIDVGSATTEVTADIGGPPGTDVFDIPMLEHLVDGEILGMTVCPFPAFAGAFIVLGDGSDVPEGKMAEPTPEQASMAIHFVDEVPCVPCADGEAGILVASGAVDKPSLLRPPKAWFANPQFVRGDARLRETIDMKSGKPSGKFACPMTVTEDGRVFGHIAQWGVCHQSPAFLNNGQCVMAPRSRVDYAGFHGTGDVLTAEGEMIGVGRMTADTGHAPTSGGYSYAQAVAHYDNSGLTTALVRAGEDEFGIWVAGSLHPSATEEQVFTMRANPPSGDWRPFGAGRELCNVLFVNNPGFPMVKATEDKRTGKILSLVAAGVPLFELPSKPLTIEERLNRMEMANKPVYALAAAHLRQKRDTLRV